MPPTDYKNAGHGAHHAAIIAAPFVLAFWDRIKNWFRKDKDSVEAHKFLGWK